MTLSEGAARRSVMNINGTIHTYYTIYTYFNVYYILLYNYFMYIILCLLCKKLLYIVHFLSDLILILLTPI